MDWRLKKANLGTGESDVNPVPISEQRRSAVPRVFARPYKWHQYAILVPSLYKSLKYILVTRKHTN